MTEQHSPDNDHLSALMDGALYGQAQQVAMSTVLSDPQARATWHAYHVVGDVLRSNELADAAQDLNFLARLEARLAQEPSPPSHTTAVEFTNPVAAELANQSANGSRWRMLGGMACSVLVAVIGLSVWWPRPATDPWVLTALPAGTMSVSPGGAAVGPDGMIRDARVDQLVNAHQQLGGHSALQMPAGFLRNATYEGAGR